MLCDECGMRPAIFHFVSIVNGEATERDLCPNCMARMKIDIPGQTGGLEGFLKNLLEEHKPKAQPEAEAADPAADALTCPQCGMSYGEFRKLGLLGCAECAKAFRDALDAPLRSIHGGTQHAGRIPGGAHNGTSIRVNIDRLRRELEKAIDEEEYEQAAKFRDAIRALQAQLDRREGSVRVRPHRRISEWNEGGEDDA